MRSCKSFCSSCRHNCAICWIINFVLSVLPATQWCCTVHNWFNHYNRTASLWRPTNWSLNVEVRLWFQTVHAYSEIGLIRKAILIGDYGMAARDLKVGERKTWTQSEFCTWQNSVRCKSPRKCICSVLAQETTKRRAKFGWPPLSDVGQ